jgi:hypothetical protein
MWSNNTFFRRGLFPFLPDNVPTVFAPGGLANVPPFSDYWLFPEFGEAGLVGTPVGPQTGFPILLTKEQLAWFIFKAKTWQVTATGSYDFAIENFGTSTQYEGEFAFEFFLGRNILENGDPVDENTIFSNNLFPRYFPNEKSLLRTRDRGTIPMLQPRQETANYTETQTETRPEEEPRVTTSEESVRLNIFVISIDAQEPFAYPLFAFTESPQPISDYGSWMRKDGLVACNIIMQLIWNRGQADSNALQATGGTSYFFGSTDTVLCNALIQVPWSENGLSIPLYWPQAAAEAAPLTMSDIVISPITFWDY